MKIIKSIIFIAIALALLNGGATAQDKPDANQLFYTGNHYYQKQDYVNAVDQYVKLLDTGVESGALYYNIGNGFLKLGKIGYAILCYEKAKRMIPHDSDLKSNLVYARSLIDEAADDGAHKSLILRLMLKSFSDVNLESLALITLGTYLLLCALMTLFMLKPVLSRKIGFTGILVFAIFLFNAASFGVRYYGESVLKHGVVVKKGVEAKYEPIDKSTTYYTLKEGTGAIIQKTKEGWRQIRRQDGKTGWVTMDAVEEI